MRTAAGILGLILTGCGVDSSQLSEAPPSFRGTVTLKPQKATLTGTPVPTTLEFTLIGRDPLSKSQTAMASVRSFDGRTEPVVTTSTATGVRFELLRLSPRGFSIDFEPFVARVRGPRVNVSGTISLMSGDVIDFTPFTGEVGIEAEPGGAELQLRSSRPSGALRPFDELELRLEQPVAMEELRELQVMENGAPLEVSFDAVFKPFSNLYRVQSSRLLEPGAKLTLAGAVSHAGAALVVPSNPQVVVETPVGGWQSTSFEARANTRTVDGAPVSPVMHVVDGAAVWRREVVPAGARQLKLWARSLAIASQAAPSGPEIILVTEAGTARVLARVDATNACKVDHFTFCSEWRELSVDVSGLSGRTAYLEATSSAQTFVAPLQSGFQLGEPAFSN